MAVAPVAAKGATALIAALNSAKTVKSTKALLDNTKELNKAWESGAIQGATDMWRGVNSSGPAREAWTVFFAQLKAGTAEPSAKLLKELLELFASSAGQEGIQLLIDLLKGIINSTAQMVDWIDRLGESTSVIGRPGQEDLSQFARDPPYSGPHPDEGGGGGPQQVY